MYTILITVNKCVLNKEGNVNIYWSNKRNILMKTVCVYFSFILMIILRMKDMLVYFSKLGRGKSKARKQRREIMQ